MKKVLFFRNFKGVTGGDLKVWHYFNHVLSSPSHTAYIRFSPDSRWDSSNPWNAAREHVLEQGAADFEPDMMFLSGNDWLRPRAREGSRVPIVNLIQGIRKHTEPEANAYRFLSNPAIRISVGPELTQALEETGRVRGPIVTIPNCIDVDEVMRLAPPGAERDIDLLVVAVKMRPLPTESPPEIGRRLFARLQRPGRKAALIDAPLPRPEFLRLMRRAKVSVFLPYRVESCSLTLIEAMALRTIVVCPDCVGNRSYCHPGVNSFRPRYEEDEIVEAAEAALADPDALGPMVDAAEATARGRDLSTERKAFLAMLDDVDELWDGIE